MTELDVDVVIEAARQFVSAHGHHIAGTLFPDDLARKLGTGMDMQADLELMAEDELLVSILFPALPVEERRIITRLLLARRIIAESDNRECLVLGPSKKELDEMRDRLGAKLTEFQTSFLQTKLGMA